MSADSTTVDEQTAWPGSTQQPNQHGLLEAVRGQPRAVWVTAFAAV